MKQLKKCNCSSVEESVISAVMKNNICSGSLPLVVEQCVTKVLSECKENEKDLQALSFETIHMQGCVSDQIELRRAEHATLLRCMPSLV